MHSTFRNKASRSFAGFLFIVYSVVAIGIILFKHNDGQKSHFGEDINRDALRKNISQGNYIPFSTARYYITGTDKLRYSVENLIGNILLFVPAGILLPLVFRKIDNFKKIIRTSLIASFVLEIIQLFFILGNFDVDDILLNILGATIGFGLYILAKALKTVKRAHISE